MVSVDSDVIDKIIKIVKDGGGEVFEQEGYINFCGVRNNATNDTFNDTLYIYWKENGSFKCVKTRGFTTKPGKRVILNEKGDTNSNGAAIVKEGWHPDVWHHGKHSGKYDALRQDKGITKPITITRDKTQFGKKGNYELRIFSDTTETGYPFTNMHRAGDNKGNNVNGWSAGCQVFQYKDEFEEMLIKAKNASKKGQTKFSYFLTNKTVFDQVGIANNNKDASYNFDQSKYTESVGSSSKSTSTSGSYGGCGSVTQLGSYTNVPVEQSIQKQSQNREDVLNTLVNGSHTPNNIKKCNELTSAEKKKNIKTKSED
jgi:hypothetical protein